MRTDAEAIFGFSTSVQLKRPEPGQAPQSMGRRRTPLDHARDLHWGDQSWRGWWGADPPFHTPVFVLTNHPREPLEMKGGTTFHFVTDGIEAALDRAMAAADGKDVSLGGGARVAQQYLQAGLIDEMHLHVVPMILGAGSRLFDNLDGGPVGYEYIDLVSSAAVTHYTYMRKDRA